MVRVAREVREEERDEIELEEEVVDRVREERRDFRERS